MPERTERDELLQQLNESEQRNQQLQEQNQQLQLLVEALKQKVGNLVAQSAIDEFNLRGQLERLQNPQQQMPQQGGPQPQPEPGLRSVPDAGASDDDVSPSEQPATSKTKAPD